MKESGSASVFMASKKQSGTMAVPISLYIGVTYP